MVPGGSRITINEDQWLTTGQAAKICSVTPDAVLKWIKKGRIQAVRTAGGHFRLRRDDLENFILSPHLPGNLTPPPRNCIPQPLRCWEYMSRRGQLPEECSHCVVYRVRAAWCFEVADLDSGSDLGHARKFCGTMRCRDCPYYRRVRGLISKVLIVTRNERLISNLENNKVGNLALAFAENGYQAAALIGSFQPAFVVVDQRVLDSRNRDLLDNLAQDSRIPGMKILLFLPPDSSRQAHARGQIKIADGLIEGSMNVTQIALAIEKFPVELPVVQSCEGATQST